MRLGLGSYTYTWAIGVPGQEPAQPLTAPDLVRRAAAAGVGCVQIADNLPLDALADGERRDLRTLAAEMAVAIEVGARGLTAERLERFLDLAVFFHSPILRFVIDGPGHEPTIDDVVGLVRAALPRLRETGVRLAIENHDRLKATALREVVAALAPPTLNLHLKDFTVGRVSHQMRFTVTGCPAKPCGGRGAGARARGLHRAGARAVPGEFGAGATRASPLLPGRLLPTPSPWHP